jgi:hypothetical protein
MFASSLFKIQRTESIHGHIIIIIMAQQPRLLGRAHPWQLVTGQLAALLFYRS